jgi:hypothetical protein
VRGKGSKLGEGCPKVRLGQDRLPNRAISACLFLPAEIGGNRGRFYLDPTCAACSG